MTGRHLVDPQQKSIGDLTYFIKPSAHESNFAITQWSTRKSVIYVCMQFNSNSPAIIVIMQQLEMWFGQHDGIRKWHPFHGINDLFKDLEKFRKHG